MQCLLLSCEDREKKAKIRLFCLRICSLRHLRCAEICLLPPKFGFLKNKLNFLTSLRVLRGLALNLNRILEARYLLHLICFTGEERLEKSLMFIVNIFLVLLFSVSVLKHLHLDIHLHVAGHLKTRYSIAFFPMRCKK